MKKLNNKGFAISTLIYGVLILFVLIMSVLIATLNFRYRSLSGITTRAEKQKDKYRLNIGISLDANNDSYVIPYSGTYTFSYIGKDPEENDKEKECSVYLEKDSIIKHNRYRLFIGETELNNCDFEDTTTINVNKIETTEKLTDDISGANMPDLRTGLVPVKYNETKEKWVVTTADDPEWYDYSKQKWANAVSLDLSTSANQTKYLNEDGTYKKETELTLPTESLTDSDVLAMFVWIPRYSYTIGCLNSDTECYGYRLNDNPDTDPGDPTATLPGAIDIKFINSDVRDEENASYTYNAESRNPDNYYTHPAFTFGEEELSGIWVGKFETSTDIKSSCYTNIDECNNLNQIPKILPNVSSLRNQNVYNQFYTSKKFSEDDNYSIDGDTHMMKNSEWAAVAYLSQSIYGKYGNSSYSGTNKEIFINNFNTYITGGSGASPSSEKFLHTQHIDNIGYRYDSITNYDCNGCGPAGLGTSTTGNIYGIYDMNGGANEYVMAKFKSLYTTESGFEQSWFDGSNSKYYDEFEDLNFSSVINQNTKSQALYETSSWYSDATDVFTSTENWILRGGAFENKLGSGIFHLFVNNGGASAYRSFRVALAY